RVVRGGSSFGSAAVVRLHPTRRLRADRRLVGSRFGRMRVTRERNNAEDESGGKRNSLHCSEHVCSPAVSAGTAHIARIVGQRRSPIWPAVSGLEQQIHEIGKA